MALGTFRALFILGLLAGTRLLSLGSTLPTLNFSQIYIKLVMNIYGYFQAWFSLSLLYQGKSLISFQKIDILELK